MGQELSVGDGTKYEGHSVGSASSGRFTTPEQQLNLSEIFSVPGSA